MPTFIDPDSRLQRLIGAAQPRLRRVFLRGILQLRRELGVQQLAELIGRGAFEEILPLVEAAAGRVASTSEVVFLDAASDTGEFLSRQLGTIISFNQVNERAVSMMQRARLDLVREIVEDQRAAIRQVLTESTRRGLNPVSAARELRPSLGLTSRQVETVSRFRSLLEQGSARALRRQLRDRRFDPSIRAAAEGRRPLSGSQIDRMTERYRERLLAHRARVVARTEALRSVHQGSEEMYQQAFDRGVLAPDEVTVIWHTARDPRVRDSHEAMEGQQRAQGEPFTSGQGAQLRHPGDPQAPANETIQCRCALSRRVQTS